MGPAKIGYGQLAKQKTDLVEALKKYGKDWDKVIEYVGDGKSWELIRSTAYALKNKLFRNFKS